LPTACAIKVATATPREGLSIFPRDKLLEHLQRRVKKILPHPLHDALYPLEHLICGCVERVPYQVHMTVAINVQTASNAPACPIDTQRPFSFVFFE